MTIQFPRVLWDVLEAEAEFDLLYDYSGHDMFGDTCIGIAGTTGDLLRFAARVATWNLDGTEYPDQPDQPEGQDLVNDLAEKVRSDKADLDTIFYFPGVRVQRTDGDDDIDAAEAAAARALALVLVANADIDQDSVNVIVEMQSSDYQPEDGLSATAWEWTPADESLYRQGYGRVSGWLLEEDGTWSAQVAPIVRCLNPGHDHTTHQDLHGNDLDGLIPKLCRHDGRPAHYDSTIDADQHDDGGADCPLISRDENATPCRF